MLTFLREKDKVMIKQSKETEAILHDIHKSLRKTAKLGKKIEKLKSDLKHYKALLENTIKDMRGDTQNYLFFKEEVIALSLVFEGRCLKEYYSKVKKIKSKIEKLKKKY